jgi:hypothetical protein
LTGATGLALLLLHAVKPAAVNAAARQMEFGRISFLLRRAYTEFLNEL